MKKTVKKFIISTCLALSANSANATAFNFTENINGTVVSGTFLGTVESGDANLINNISDFSFSFNGITNTALSYDLYGPSYINPYLGVYGYEMVNSASPIMSFDGRANNILVDIANGNGSFTNYSGWIVTSYYLSNQFQSVAALKSISDPNSVVGAASYGNIDGYSVTPVISGEVTVPEPTSVALLALGLLGFAASRRKKSNVQDVECAADYCV